MTNAVRISKGELNHMRLGLGCSSVFSLISLIEFHPSYYTNDFQLLKTSHYIKRFRPVGEVDQPFRPFYGTA